MSTPTSSFSFTSEIDDNESNISMEQPSPSSSELSSESIKEEMQDFLNIVDSLFEGSLANKIKAKITKHRKELVKKLHERRQMTSYEWNKKVVKYRTGIQKTIRAMITGNANRSIRRYIQELPQVKLIDKLCFTFSVVHVMLSELFLLYFHQYFKYYYAIMLIPLIIMRGVDYHSKQQRYFLFDFCYFMNLVILLHIYFFDYDTLFEVLFVLSNGPVFFAIVIWRNAMVFHSVDKMTSLFIHCFPPLYSFVQRWLIHDYNNRHDNLKSLSFVNWFIYPTIVFFIWQMLYIVKIEFIDKDYLNTHPNEMTSLRYFVAETKHGLYKKLLRLCRDLKIMRQDEIFNAFSFKTKCIYVITYFMYFLCTLLPANLFFRSQLFHGVMLLFILTISIWNGATYYIDIFSERYNEQLNKKQQLLIEKYALVDENLDNILKNQEILLRSSNNMTMSHSQHDDEKSECDNSNVNHGL